MTRISDSNRVMFVTPLPPFFLSHRLAVVRAARARGFEPHIAVPATEFTPQLRDAGLIVHEIEFDRSTTNPVRLMGTARALRKLVRDVSPAVVHAIAVQAAFVTALAAGGGAFPPVVTSFTGLGHLWTPPDSLPRAAIRRSVSTAIALSSFQTQATWVFQNSDDERSFLDAAVTRNRARIAQVAGSGVSLAAFSTPRAESRRDTVLFLGRTLHDKGIRDFVRLAEDLRMNGSRDSLRVRIAGMPDPTNPTSLSASDLDALKSSGAIDDWGHECDVPSLLARTKLLVFPSHREGFPKAVMEASAAGVPTLGYDVPGVRHAVLHGKTGELVPFDDAVAFIAAARRLLADEARLAAYGLAARECAAERFDENDIASRVVDLYPENAARFS